MSVTINFNIAGIMADIESANEFATFATAKRVRDDSNLYCPQDTETLIKSSLTNSDLENGIVVWEGPGASYLYHGVLMVGKNGSAWAKFGEKKKVKTPQVNLNFAKDKNPNAQMMWAHKAKDVHMDDWERTYQTAFRREWG